MTLPPDDTLTGPPMSRLWWSVPAVAFVLFVGIAMVFGSEQKSVGEGTGYDAGTKGFRGAYLVLEELGYPVELARRPAGGGARWVLSPLTAKERDAAPLLEWIRRGGRVLLADPGGEFATLLGVEVAVEERPAPESIPTTLRDVSQLAPGPTVVTPKHDPGQSWEAAGGEPLISIHPQGLGEVWLLHRPLALRNDYFSQADNAVFACRLAEAMLATRTGPLAFDEFQHGLRDRPGVLELLWQKPLRYVTLQALLLSGLVLWRSAVRFGPPRPLPPRTRRSKEEFLDALAELLHRQGDTDEAFRTVQHDLLRRLAEETGMPGTADPEAIVNRAALRRGVDIGPLLPVLTAPRPPGSPGHTSFLTALRSLESASHDLLRSR